MIKQLVITDSDSVWDPGAEQAIPFAANKVLAMHPTEKRVLTRYQKHVITIPVVAMANIADAMVLKRVLPFPFTLDSIAWRQGDKAVTTAAKLSTATAQINTTSVTGGAVALTSALCTPAGANIAGSEVTALNTGAAGDTVGVIFSSTTAFVEGSGWFDITVTELAA